MFPKKLVEIISLKWFILELNKLQTSPTSTDICENEQVWPADFPTIQAMPACRSRVHVIANLNINSAVSNLRHAQS